MTSLLPNTPRRWAVALLAVALLALPPAAQALGEPFYISLVSRVLVFALAAMSLDLILGFGGLVCFGHAMFVGVGAYVVGILAHHAAEETLLLGLLPGTASGWIAWPLAMLCAGALAAAVGFVSLRTKGVHFIMITLAFAQMAYFFFVSLRAYGGDDGLSLAARSTFSGLVSLRDKVSFYYVALGVLAVVGLLLWRVTGSRFGMVLQGAKANERRMVHIGFPVFRYRLAAFALAGAVAGLAGALLANQANFVSPAMMHWTRSGEIIVMVILGGMGTLVGPVVGAFVFLLLEEALSGWTEHWQVVFGPALLLAVIYARQGLYGLLPVRESAR
ncbi:branched-chain amino acid ABC transporter permease [Azospirillum sp. TSO22-1]|uniref:branched-chain amino acid ABC transporter permease n=1 Tax=Azospirillum sp. TSO22-1 TaxID=716789 RepID=UPI000D61F958|nr:branched-chain amino acid ABC transporter permease [Azospirillum sp. TSO22-1]PWC53484.1 ABC transporter permease [Azospirillum sp. TSO22-1]